MQVAGLQANDYWVPLPTLQRWFELLDIDPPFVLKQSLYRALELIFQINGYLSLFDRV
jgi:hypothetical protein